MQIGVIGGIEPVPSDLGSWRPNAQARDHDKLAHPE